MNTTNSTISVSQQSKSMSEFRVGVNDLLEKRSYFISQVLPKLKSGIDYYEIKGRRSLSKGGAEKLCSIYKLSATFEKDNDTIGAFLSIPGLIAYVCTLTRNGVVYGQARGSSMLSKCEGDPNKAIKMAEKSSYISATIRTTGLSDIFTSDLENMSFESISPSNIKKVDIDQTKKIESIFVNESSKIDVNEPATEKQKDLLAKLIKKTMNGVERTHWLKEMEVASKFDASEMISSMFMLHGRNMK